tara:strand:+ start:2980 stop:3828 length:849 start_codon:yes stop_codon:yes gene_type:complete
MKKQLAGIIPVSGIKTNFNMPWHESLMPIAPNYLAIERSVLECAYAGCSTIWIVCADDVTPLIRYQVGELVQDPVYNYRHFEFNKQDFKRPIRIYYIPVHIRDFNKRDSLSWSAIYGAYSANKILSKVSAHLAPNQFWISWPYGYYTPSVTREIRKVISKDSVALEYNGDCFTDNLYLGFTLDSSQVEKLISEAYTRSNGIWQNPKKREEKIAVEKRYCYGKFDMKKTFETLNISGYKKESIGCYYNLDNWADYCYFLSQSKISKPKILKSREWNEIGYDEE